MKAHPPATDLLASVSRFLREELLPALSGVHAFNVRVSINAIELVRREIGQQAGADERERERLVKLLGSDGGLGAMRQLLCDKIAAGEITLDQPALREHLRTTTIDRLAIDQPTYSAYLAAIARSGATEATNEKPPEE
jgi:uncharacterized protein DUF6285